MVDHLVKHPLIKCFFSKQCCVVVDHLVKLGACVDVDHLVKY